MRSIASLKEELEDAVVIADGLGRIAFVNAAFERLFGWRASELLGRSLTVIIPPDLRDAHLLGFSRFTVAGNPTVINHPLVTKSLARDGRVFDATHHIVAESTEEGWSFGATIIPAGARPDGT